MNFRDLIADRRLIDRNGKLQTAPGLLFETRLSKTWNVVNQGAMPGSRFNRPARILPAGMKLLHLGHGRTIKQQSGKTQAP